jgi:hypothetical protein
VRQHIDPSNPHTFTQACAPVYLSIIPQTNVDFNVLGHARAQLDEEAYDGNKPVLSLHKLLHDVCRLQ